MYPLASIASGVLATLGILSLAVSGPASFTNVSSALTSPATTTADQLDRSRKGDRLIASKGVMLPGDTGRENSQAVPKKMPVKTLHEEDKNKRLVGCDPLVSPLAGSSLSQITGRCIAEMATGQKFAAVMQ